MGFFSWMKEKLHKNWMPYEVTYLGTYNAKELKDSEHPEQTLAGWKLQNKSEMDETLSRIRKLERKQLLSDRFSKFPAYNQELLKDLAKQYSSLRAQKKEAKDQHQQIQSYLERSGEQYDNSDLQRVIRIIEENELEFQKVQHDMSYLEGEKSALEYEFRRNQTGFLISQIALYVTSLILVFGTIILLLLSKNKDIFLPMILLIFGSAFFGVWAVVFQRYFRAALEKNTKLQQRAVKLLNKVILKYVRYRSLLDFEYEKYDINSSEALQFRYDIFHREKSQRLQYEDLEKQYRLTALDIVREMEGMISEKEADLMDLFLQNSDFFTGDVGMEHFIKNTKEEKEILYRHLQDLEKNQKILEQMKGMLG